MQTNYSLINHNTLKTSEIPELFNNYIRKPVLLCRVTKFNVSVRFYPKPGFGHAPKIMNTLSKKTPPINQVISAVNEHNQPVTATECPTIPVSVQTTPVKPVIAEEKKSFLSSIFGNTSFVNPATVGKSAGEPYHIRRNKETIYTLVNYYNNLNPNVPHDHRMYIKSLIDTLSKNPNYVLSRQGQVVIEVLNGRIRFDETLLRDLFPYFELIDLLKKNGGVCDATTMFNMLTSNELAQKFPYVMNADPKVVNATIILLFKPNDVPEEVHKFILHSQAVTGNTISDLTLCNIPFDFKATPSNNNNFIVLWDYEQFTQHNDAIRYHTAYLNVLLRIVSPTRFQKELSTTLKAVLSDNSMDLIQKQNIINETIFKNIKYMTLQDRASIIFPIDNKPFIPNTAIDNETANIPVSLKRSAIDSGQTRKAINNLVNTWSFQQQIAFHKATNDSLTKTKEATTPKEEVD